MDTNHCELITLQITQIYQISASVNLINLCNL